jgi:prefoldin subunit 5
MDAAEALLARAERLEIQSPETEATVARLTKRVADLEAARTELERSLETTREQVAGSRRDLEALALRKTELEEAVTAARAVVDARSRELAELEGKKRQMDAAKARVGELQAAITDFESEASRLQARKDALQAAIEGLREGLDAKEHGAGFQHIRRGQKVAVKVTWFETPHKLRISVNGSVLAFLDNPRYTWTELHDHFGEGANVVELEALGFMKAEVRIDGDRAIEVLEGGGRDWNGLVGKKTVVKFLVTAAEPASRR